MLARCRPTRVTHSSQWASRFATHACRVQRVVLAQRFDVAHLEAGLLHGEDDPADVDELAVGEHVAADEGATIEPRAAWRGDRVVEEAPGGPEQAAERLEVPRRAERPDVLEHPDRRDRVELLTAQVPVVLQPDLDPVAEPRLLDPLPGTVHLLPAEGHPDHLGPVVLRRMDCHRSPPAADVEETCPRPPVEGELAADQLVLGRLGLLQGRRLGDEPRARVGHRLAEDQPVEVVAHVVVVADRSGVPGRGVESPGGAALLGWRGEGAAEGAELPGRSQRLRQRPPADRAQIAGRRVTQRPQQREDVPFDGHLAAHEGARDPELAGRPEDAPDRVGGMHTQGPGPVGRAEGAAVPEREPDRSGLPEHHREQRGQCRGRTPGGRDRGFGDTRLDLAPVGGPTVGDRLSGRVGAPVRRRPVGPLRDLGDHGDLLDRRARYRPRRSYCAGGRPERGQAGAGEGACGHCPARQGHRLDRRPQGVLPHLRGLPAGHPVPTGSLSGSHPSSATAWLKANRSVMPAT